MILKLSLPDVAPTFFTGLAQNEMADAPLKGWYPPSVQRRHVHETPPDGSTLAHAPAPPSCAAPAFMIDCSAGLNVLNAQPGSGVLE